MEAGTNTATTSKTSQIRFDASYAFSIGGILKFLQIVSIIFLKCYIYNWLRREL